VLLCVGALVTLFLLGYVVPRFSAIYAETGRDLPFLSRLLLHWGELINRHGVAVLMGLAVVAALGFVFRTKVRAAFSALAMRIPGIGDRVLVYHLARFYRTAGMLLRGGTPIVPALNMVSGLLPIEV